MKARHPAFGVSGSMQRGRVSVQRSIASSAAFLAILCGGTVFYCPAKADPQLAFSTSLYGTPGLADMPTAGRFEDGDLAISFAYFRNTNRNTLTFQVTPRITASFRYSRLGGYFQSTGEALYDRSFDVSYQILAESGARPALAVGFQDFLGTGVYSAEYIVATKTFGDVQVTGGLGWGRLGGRNSLGSPFGDRPPIDVGLGGEVNYEQWFRGPVAPFGGIAWRATDRLTVKAEYSSDTYVAESARNTIDQKSPLNLGFDYRLGTSATVSGYWLYGAEAGVQFTYALNPRRPAYPSGREPGPLPVRPRPTPAENPESWGSAWVSDGETVPSLQKVVAEQLAKEGIGLERMTLTASEARLVIRNETFGAEPQAYGRTARLLTRALPASVETFIIVSMVESGVPTAAVTIRRSDLEALEHADPMAILPRVAFDDALSVAPAAALSSGDRMFRWSLTPYVSISLFDPDQPVRADFGLLLGAQAELARGVVVSGSISKRLVGNLDQVPEASNTLLPPVRSNVALYAAEGDPGIEDLTAAWYARPAPDIYSRVTVGYLEQMFGGISGEVLWKPLDSRLGLGAELSYVRQRDFDMLFGFQDYDVVTGFLSTYYAFNNGYNARLDVGRYLAGDVGATLALSRQFNNGWEIGAYVTRTDATFEEFGEGSFDKGITLTIPFEWFTGTPSQSKSQTVLRSLSRDGGAKLQVGGRLYGLVRDTDQSHLENRWGRFWR